MLTIIAKDWRIYVPRGILAVAFGLLALDWPRLTIEVLVVLFGIYAIFSAIRQLMTPTEKPRKRIGFEVREPQGQHGKKTRKMKV